MPIRAVALDVDGVLTDGTFTWSAGGEESKSYSFRDIMGISMASRVGVIFSIISGESGPLIDRYAEKMRISNVHPSCKDKSAALREFSENIGIPLENIGFVGDDVNDLSAMAIAGFSAAPSDAHPLVLKTVQYVAKAGGGHGAVRDVLDHLGLCNYPPVSNQTNEAI